MNFKKKTIKGLSWSMGTRVFQQVMQFIITAILARLLLPEDFGIVGMATVFTGFAVVFGEVGLSAAIIQKSELSDKQLSSAFWINILIGIFMVTVFAGASPLIAAFYDKPLLIPIVCTLSVSFVFSSLRMVHVALMQKKMNFKLLTISESMASLIGGCIGVIMAFSGAGVWALVFQQVSVSFLCTVFVCSSFKWQPKLVFEWKSVQSILEFGLHFTGFNLVNYFARNIDYLLIGKFVGAEALGFYTLAYKLMVYPLQHISGVISKVMFPAFSSIKDDWQKIHSVFIRMTRVISLITFPMMIGLFAVANDFILIVYGENWLPVAKLIQILCFCGMVQSVGTVIGNIRLSQGASKLHLFVGCLNAFLVLIVVGCSVQYGVYIVALAYTVFYFLWIYLTVEITYLKIKIISVKDFFSSLRLSFILNSFLFLLLTIVQKLLVFKCTPKNRLFVMVGVGGLIYVVLLLCSKTIVIKNKRISLNV